MLADSRSIPASPRNLVQINPRPSARKSHWRWLATTGIVAGAIVVLAVLIWQAVATHGSPDPTLKNTSPAAAVFDTAVLVFREGLEAILVLTALTASLVRTEGGLWKPVALGAGVSFLACIATWFIVVAIISSISATALHIQAATGLLAIVVLLVIMNWFFHKVYWTGWITLHNRRKKDLTTGAARSRTVIFRGLALIGFTSVYREGFEVVLFLQSIRLKVGSHVVLEGACIGLAFTLIVGMLTFVAHYKLPYKRMLVFTGILLGMVLLVMVGEEVQEMQQAGWLPTTTLGFNLPDWMNLWFGVYSTLESLLAQGLAGAFVVGSYYLARRVCASPSAQDAAMRAQCIVPDCGNCEAANSAAVDG